MQTAGLEPVRVEELSAEGLACFLDFCRKHRDRLDDSFLSEDDLSAFGPGPSDPTYVAWKGSRVIGAASLMIGGAFPSSGRARLRIFYSEDDDLLIYKRLLSLVSDAAEGLASLYCFIPDDMAELIAAVERLGFVLERVAYSMARKAGDVPRYVLPAGFSVRPFVAGSDENAWCEIRNSAFASLKGNSEPMTPEALSRMYEDDGAEGRMLMLLDGNRPVGVIRGAFEDRKGRRVLDIGPLAVLLEYQGKGLGRALLRALLSFAGDGFFDAALSVDSSNEPALRLYSKEGFTKDKGFACYALGLRTPG